jgi:hypothetical protein
MIQSHPESMNKIQGASPILQIMAKLAVLVKGQLISKCLFGVIIWTKKPAKFFPGFLP